jgi:hypothetical protein
MGGRQHGFAILSDAAIAGSAQLNAKIRRQKREYRSFPPSLIEVTRHMEFMHKFKTNMWYPKPETNEAEKKAS